MMNHIEQFTETFVGVALVVSFGALIIIMFIMWLFLPFAVYGIKKRLDTIAELQAQIAKWQDKKAQERLK